jgi:hypothetical protein
MRHALPCSCMEAPSSKSSVICDMCSTEDRLYLVPLIRYRTVTTQCSGVLCSWHLFKFIIHSANSCRDLEASGVFRNCYITLSTQFVLV